MGLPLHQTNKGEALVNVRLTSRRGWQGWGAVCSLWGRRVVAVVARAVAAVIVIGARWSGHWGGVFVSFPEQGVDAPSRGWRAGESQAELGLQVLGKCSSEGPGWGGKEAMLLTCCSRLLNTREGLWYGRLIDCSVRKEQMNNAREETSVEAALGLLKNTER